MRDLIVSVPDHCLSFYFAGVDENVASPLIMTVSGTPQMALQQYLSTFPYLLPSRNL